ncbi:hypothetical protein D9M71_664580 [compost metagenome]
MQCTGETLEVEGRALALDRPGVGVHIEDRGGAVGVGDAGGEGEMLLAGAADVVHRQRRLGLEHGVVHLLVAQQRDIVAGLAGAHVRVGQPDDFLAEDGQGASHADDQDEEPDGQGQPAVHQKPEF